MVRRKLAPVRKRTGTAFLEWQRNEYEQAMRVKRGELVWQAREIDTDALRDPKLPAGWSTRDLYGKYVAVEVPLALAA